MNPSLLENDLKKKIRGEVYFDAGSKALYATDASNYRQVPIGVVIPKDTEDVLQALSICREYDAPVLTRGAGTSLAGQCCNVAVVIDFSKYLNKIIEIDPAARIARVEPGVVLDTLRNVVKPHHLTFGPDPATHNRCTFGGMIGNNACGVHSIMSGKTVDNIEALEILTYDGLRMRVGKTSDQELSKIIAEGGRRGEIYQRLRSLRDQYASLIRTRFPKLPRRVSGYNLDELLPENGFHLARALVGTEGTCATVLEATIKLVHNPPFRSLAVLGYSDIFNAADDVPRVLLYKPIGLEALDKNFVQGMKRRGLHPNEIPMLPEGNSWLLVEFGGDTQAEAIERANQMVNGIKGSGTFPSAKIFETPKDQKLIWSIRESTFGASVFVPGQPDTYAGFEDSAVPPEKLGPYLRDLQKLYDQYNYFAVTYGHFGDGCIHSRISFDLHTADGIKKYRDFQAEAADLVIQYGGSLSGEHGDGQTWGEFLPKMFGPELVKAFEEFKAIWDPANKMNPGKVVKAYRSDENLRLKEYSTIPQPELHFNYAEEKGSFARLTQRCIGIGKCLKKDEGTMCPSYMATHEEKHSTRGRAHLLFEMMRGEVLKGGWHDEHVKESLDLCLACKGCKSECPVGVDMATYKAEFLSHYYKGRLRPLKAYAFGLIHQWGRIVEHVPKLANGFIQNPIFGTFAKSILGIARERQLPRFESPTFRQWFQKRPVDKEEKPQVMLWPDTFNNYFYPEILKSAVMVLEKAGYQVLLPKKPLCCGRPLYDYGMLKQAKRMLQDIIVTLEPYARRGISFIGLEPSCIAVFRDELLQLFPNDARAALISQHFFSFAEFFEQKAKHYKLRQLSKKAIVHGHCHQKALWGMDDEEKILSKLGLEFEILNSGCCGMAGAFGFEKEHYEISKEIGEQILIPAVKRETADTLVISNGFSCREQILHLTGRRALHLSEVMQMAGR